MAVKKVLVATIKNPVLKATDKYKNSVTDFYSNLVFDYKIKIEHIVPNKNYNYIIDFYTKWHRHYFYFCIKYKAEYENRILDEFETKEIRLEFMGEDLFEFSYFRHTGQWQTIAENQSLNDCLKLISENDLLGHFF